MLYLLDTNVIVIYLNQRSLILKERLAAIALEDIAVCSVVKLELLVILWSNAEWQPTAKFRATTGIFKLVCFLSFGLS
ncbi:MAG: hypothetical protein SWX82_17365 [Cyanobacteriota bacterium]|nr:hypothetical protein [Cyanobacteriota bacterium]